MSWKCGKGHEWYVAFQSMRENKTWCPVCMYENFKLSLYECQKHAVSKGGKCLAETYVGINEKMDWECGLGHKWSACFRNIKHLDQWCPSCLYKNEQKCREIFERLTGKLFPKKRGIFSNPYLELDGYNEELKIGFEYQGRQHYVFVDHFHRNGPEDLEDQQKRDVQKREECERLGIRLIEIPHDMDDPEKFICETLGAN